MLSFSRVNNFGEGTGNGKQVCTVYVCGTFSRTLPNLSLERGVHASEISSMHRVAFKGM